MEVWSDPAAPMTSPVIEPPAVRKLESRKCFAHLSSTVNLFLTSYQGQKLEV